MLKTNSSLCDGVWKNFLVFAATVVFFVLLFRNIGIYPTVFGDEYIYSKFSRLLPLADSTIPGYIYLTIYGVTNVCGDKFLDCARILNAIFFVAAAPFIYLITRRVCTRSVATIVLLLVLLGPINSYTAYFMPEALFFFSFWLLTWFILRLDNSTNWKLWCFAGMLLGLSALVKPHALFLLPAMIVYILYVSRKKEGEWMLLAFRNVIIFVAFSFITKLLIGYLFAGRAGITIFGPLYNSVASSNTSDFQHYLDLVALSTEILKGHVLAICIMFGLPIAFAINASLISTFTNVEIKTDQKISFYALSVLISLVIVAIIFSASVAGSGLHETAFRLHMRYYNFALPLLLIIAASQLSLEPSSSRLKWRVITALPIGVAVLYAIYTRLSPYTPYIVDSPEIWGFTFAPTVFYVLSGISLLSLALWVYSTRFGAKTFVYLFMPLAVAFSTFYLNQELRQRLEPSIFDKAGNFTKQYLPSDELSKLVIVGSDLVNLYHTAFYLDNPYVYLQAIPSGSNYDLSKLPAGKEWLLIIGDHQLKKNTFFQLAVNGFTLTRVTDSNTVDFKKPAWPGVISSSEGLHSAEPWGRWSSGKSVTLEFAKPLPERFTIHLVAFAFGPNVGKEFVAHVGGSSVGFSLGGFPLSGASPEVKVIEFYNTDKTRTITIEIPFPTTPKEIGLSSDERRLGIGLSELSIKEF
jgi:phosphoglycerol transferase